MDWGLGQYERTARRLLPAAEVVVDAAAPAPGERIVDVGCGTGSASLIAAARGARVTGVDPAPRLLEVARAEAAKRGLDATFVEGDAAALPVADGDADAVISAFAVIFAPDPSAAVAELARVTTGAGRIVLSAWIPQGAMAETARVAREALTRAAGQPARRPFPWHDRDALAALLDRTASRSRRRSTSWPSPPTPPRTTSQPTGTRTRCPLPDARCSSRAGRPTACASG